MFLGVQSYLLTRCETKPRANLCWEIFLYFKWAPSNLGFPEKIWPSSKWMPHFEIFLRKFVSGWKFKKKHHLINPGEKEFSNIPLERTPDRDKPTLYGLDSFFHLGVVKGDAVWVCETGVCWGSLRWRAGQKCIEQKEWKNKNRPIYPPSN